jgi:hypothetical protein
MSAVGNAFLFLAAVSSLGVAPAVLAQERAEQPESARAAAPIDLTGQWVSVVTEDWRWRMITPPRGDYESIPLTPEGRATADSWDLAADNAAQLQCKAFGAGGIMRVPGRIHITWQDAGTLRLQTDAGEQVRLFNFITPVPGTVVPALDDRPIQAGARSWQGHTKAQWFRQPQSRGLGFGGAQNDGGTLRAVTYNASAGYLRANGVPYSDNAVITENFTVFDHGDDTWLVVTTIVEDPLNLTQPFITSTNFKKENNRSNWSPSPCRTDPPIAPPAVAAEE